MCVCVCVCVCVSECVLLLWTYSPVFVDVPICFLRWNFTFPSSFVVHSTYLYICHEHGFSLFFLVQFSAITANYLWNCTWKKKKGSPESLLDWGLTDLQIIILKEAAGAFGDEQIGFGGCRERRGGSFCHSKSHFSFGLAAGRCAAAAPLHSNDGGEKEQLLAQRTFPSTLLFPWQSLVVKSARRYSLILPCLIMFGGNGDSEVWGELVCVQWGAVKEMGSPKAPRTGLLP